MVETFIETGMRWGELVTLRPRHIDFLRRQLTVEETIVEVSKKHSPTVKRYIVKPYRKTTSPAPLASGQRCWKPSPNTQDPTTSAADRRAEPLNGLPAVDIHPLINSWDLSRAVAHRLAKRTCVAQKASSLQLVTERDAE